MNEKIKIGIIGRGKELYDIAKLLIRQGFDIPVIITAKEAPEYKVKASDYKVLATEIGAEFIQTPKINTPDVVNKIKGAGKLFIGISINFTGIIEQEIIDHFQYGILNAHAGDLPRYRGNACGAWAIINGEKKVGLCIHKMKGNELDSGDIITRTYFDLTPDTRVGEIYQWMEDMIPVLMIETIAKLAADPGYVLEKQSTDIKDALRCYPRNPDDGKINWNDPNEKILKLINASSEPFAGAFCEYDGNKTIIWRAHIFDDNEVYCAVPGQVSRINQNGTIEVICGSGKIRLEEMEINGERGKPATLITSIRKRLK